MTETRAFQTLIEESDTAFHGPWRGPRNMLSEQTYGGHASVHDEDTAQKMGFAAAPIEGPTHFSQFAPLCCHIWGDQWLAEGGLSVSYKAAVAEGEQVRAYIAKPANDETQLAVWMIKKDGTEVLRGTASFGDDYPPSAVDEKLANLSPPDPKRVIMRNIVPGAKRPRIHVNLGRDNSLGPLYPFSLREKLALITEQSDWYAEGAVTPWGGPILPIEMVSVLVHHAADSDPWLGSKATIDLFVDQEIRMIKGPLLVGSDYEIERTVIALSGSRRTESCWVRSDIFLPGGQEILATMILNVASFKDSYADYDKELAEIETQAV
tara:strand:- start:2565 stop:3530 length:966 start_codon:yes stop_codon:yes gene_type:complete